MAVTTPREFDVLFAKAFNSGDGAGLLGLYEPGAMLIPEPGSAAVGRDAIGEAMQAFLALKGQIDMRTTATTENGDLAVVLTDWSLGGAVDPDGNPVELAGKSTVVLRRQADGTWLGVIDDPYSLG